MGILTSPGQWNHEIAQSIYSFARKYVNILVKSGKITADMAETEFAKKVAADLIKQGLKVPAKIAELLK